MATPRDSALVPVAFAPDQETAERWAHALEDAGIEDGAHLSPVGSAYGPLLGGQPFIYPVLVSRLRRRAAQRALASEAATDALTATQTITPRSIGTAAAVVGSSILLVLYLAWARGDL